MANENKSYLFGFGVIIVQGLLQWPYPGFDLLKTFEGTSATPGIETKTSLFELASHLKTKPETLTIELRLP